MDNLVVFLVCLAGMILGSVTDIRKREVPDWVNFGLIFSGVGLNLILTIIYRDWHFIVASLIGLGLFYLIALLMFYTAQWGGGDSKMLMGIGALVGIPVGWPIMDTLSYWFSDPYHTLPFLFYFLIFTMFAGSIYGIVWSVVVSIRNFAEFRKDFLSRINGKVMMKWLLLGFGIIVLLVAAFSDDLVVRLGVLSTGVIVVMSFYLFNYIKSVEKVCMQRFVSPEKLTEGDWIVDDIKVGKKVIAGPKDLGISREQIAELVRLHKAGKIKEVLIKEGIPFVPSFLMGFVAAWLYLILW